MKDSYSDIINLPHHVSERHTPMSREARAAQFAPFAALTGHEEAINETARLTDKKLELNEEQLAELDHCINYLLDHIKEKPMVEVTYFVPDKRKSGGMYLTVKKAIKRIDTVEMFIEFEDRKKLAMEDVFHMCLSENSFP